MDIFSPTIIDNAIITGSNNASLLQVSSPSAASAFFISGSGNIGIGTTSPISTLSVAGGNININDGYSIGGNALGSYVPFLRYNNTGAGVPSSSFGHTTAYITSLGGGVFGTNDLIFYAGGLTQTEIMRMVGSTGFVGIGETSPSARLEIRGSGATSATTALRVEDSAATARLTILDDGTSAFNTSHLYVSSSGNVGIGTATPVHNLVVDGNTGVSINAGGATFPNIHRDSTDGGMLLRSWNGSTFTNNVKITPTTEVGIGTITPTAELHVSGASNAGLFEIDSPAVNNIIYVSGSGNVGIGTATPFQKLYVDGDIGLKAANFLNLAGDQGSSRTAGFQASFASYDKIFVYTNNSIIGSLSRDNGWGIGFSTQPSSRLQVRGSGATSGTTALRVENSNQSASLVVLDDGNVGIGTTSPSQKLDVSGSINVRTTAPTVFFDRNGAYTWRITNGDGSTFPLSTLNIANNASTAVATFLDNGNVGIGTTTPTNTLQVVGGITATSITSSLLGTASVAVTAQTASFLPTGTYNITSSWATNALTASNITPSITNNTDNRVLTATGGGTINGESNLTFDGSVLTVTGRANISTSITSSTANVGFGLTSALNAGQSTIRGSGVDTVGALTIQNSGGTAVFTVLNGGTTGVGENNPSARLHVKGSGATSATTALRVENSSAAARLTILDDGTSAFNTSHLYVSSSGRVGVGTTTPRELLHVGGGNLSLDSTRYIDFGNGNSRINDLGLVSGQGYSLRITTFGPIGTGTANSLTEKLRLTGSGSLGLGTDSPSARFHISGGFTDGNLMRVQSPTGAEYFFISASGNVGIGTGTPTNTLQVVGGITATSITASIISASSGITGSLFGTSSWATNALTASFVTTLNQNVLVTGSLTIGATSLGANENTLVLGPAPAGGTGEGGQILLQSPGGIYTSASMWDNYQNLTRLLRGTNAGSDAVVSAFNMHTKQMQLPAYNSTTAFVGTVAGVLGFDSSGNILTTTTSGASPAFPFTGSAQITGSLSVTGPISSTAAITSTANNQMYFRGGDDAEFWDINIANTVGIYGQQNASVASIKLGSGGGIISGQSSSIGINTTSPTARLHVSGASADSLLRVGSPTDSNILFVTGSGNVGIHTSAPTQWIYLSTTPSTGKYLNIDAAQTSNNPPDYGAGGGGGVDRIIGNTLDNFALGTPDYWMEIKLNGGIVLIPAYLPA